MFFCFPRHSFQYVTCVGVDNCLSLYFAVAGLVISVVFIGWAVIFQLVCIAEVLFITAQQTSDMIQCSLELTFMGYG